VFAVSVFIPIVGFMGALFVTLPVLFYRQKIGITKGGTVAVLSAFLMLAVIGGASIDLWFFLQLLLIGFVLGELFELNMPVEATVLFTVVAAIGSGLAALLLTSLVSGTGMVDLVTKYVGRNLELTLELYKRLGVAPENIDMLSRSLEHIRYVLVRILPALVVISTLFVTWVNLLLARPVLGAKRLPFPAYGPLSRWRAPERLVWGVIGGGIIVAVAGGTLKLLGLNGLLILTMVYFFQGIAIVAFFFEKKRFPRLLRIFIYSLVAVQQMLLLIVIALGLFDTWFNFRKLEPNSPATVD
jgi:uncharacterized protein YybS (DUF2232 family)